jgi:hypothetical protein
MSGSFRVTTAFVARFAGAALALAVAGIHITDQGGLPGSKTPDYIGVGYYLLEGVAVLTAAALLLPLASRLRAAAWATAAVFVSAGPLLGYVVSRGPGLPDYDDDIGNWTEPLGVVSLLVESALLALPVAVLIAARRARSRSTTQLQRPTPDSPESHRVRLGQSATISSDFPPPPAAARASHPDIHRMALSLEHTPSWGETSIGIARRHAGGTGVVRH